MRNVYKFEVDETEPVGKTLFTEIAISDQDEGANSVVKLGTIHTLHKGTFIKDVPFFVTFLRYLPTLVPFCPIFRYIPKIGRPTLSNIPTPRASLTINLLSVENSKCLYKSNFY